MTRPRRHTATRLFGSLGLCLTPLLLAFLMGACERITVDPKEIDLTRPYIPIISPEGEKLGEQAPRALPTRRERPQNQHPSDP